jgi:outer membrane protein assembly factor BamB
MAAGVRVVPIAALATFAVLAVGSRIARTRRSQHGATRIAPADVTPASRPPSSLAAPEPRAPARVAEHAARMLHGDPHHTHRATGRLPRAIHPAWTYAADGPVEAQVTSSADEQTLYAASLGGSLTALERNGMKRWSVSLGGRAYATPCVADDGTVYVGSDAGRFFAVTADGRVRWTLETGSDADTGAVIAKDGSILFASGSRVFSVLQNGDIAWRFQAKQKVFTAPAITDDERIIFGSQDGHVYALSSKGELSWSTDLGRDADGAAAIGDDGAIFVGTDAGEVVRLDSTGSVVWRANVGGFVRGTLSLARNGDVLAGVYGPSPREVRVTPDGEVRGSFPIAGTGARDFGVHGGALEDAELTLVFGAQDDAVYAVDARGELLWRWATGGDVDAPVTLLSDGTLVVPSDDAHIYALAP